MVNFVQLEHATPKVKVAEKGIQIPPYGGYQIIVDTRRHIVAEEGRFACRGIIPCPCMKHIRSHRASQTRGQGEFVVLEFVVKLMKCRLPYLRIALLKKGGKRTLGQLAFIALGIRQFSKLHIDIRELRKCLTMSADCG